MDIKASKYEEINIDDIVQQQHHLNSKQKQSLHNVFQWHTQLFLGKLGWYPHKKIDLELEPTASPVHLKPYPVTHAHEPICVQDLKHLCTLGVLSCMGTTEWAFPTFIIPKKDGHIWWVGDFREFNKVIKCMIYTLPWIQDILQNHPGYFQFMKLDISMQYYNCGLTESQGPLYHHHIFWQILM